MNFEQFRGNSFAEIINSYETEIKFLKAVIDMSNFISEGKDKQILLLAEQIATLKETNDNQKVELAAAHETNKDLNKMVDLLHEEVKDLVEQVDDDVEEEDEGWFSFGSRKVSDNPTLLLLLPLFIPLCILGVLLYAIYYGINILLRP